MPFRSKESYAHYYAKETFKEWLHRTWDFNRAHGYKNVLSIFDWEIDCSDPQKGVRLEYPIYSKTLSDGRKDILGLRSLWKELPTEEQVQRGNLLLEATIDLVICEKGRAKYGIEIVHKHICGQKKRDFLSSLKSLGIDFPVYEVSASWILDQLHGFVPKQLDMVRV